MQSKIIYTIEHFLEVDLSSLPTILKNKIRSRVVTHSQGWINRIASLKAMGSRPCTLRGKVRNVILDASQGLAKYRRVFRPPNRPRDLLAPLPCQRPRGRASLAGR